MNEFDIWTEGYVATGESSGAVFHGKSTGKTFKEAVVKMVKTWSGYKEHFDEEKLTYWACRFFDNETDARKSFG